MEVAEQGPLRAYSVEKLPWQVFSTFSGGTSPLALSEIDDPGPFYEVDFLVTTISTAALEFFNTIGPELPVTRIERVCQG